MIIRYLIALTLWCWLAGCANQIPLEGGPKDVTPPRLLKSVPDTFATRVLTRKITLTFDEFLVLKDPVRQVVVTPPLQVPPQVKLKGKEVEVVFEDSLMPNTTYSINFGQAITDNNEGNILTNFQYVFSTGTYLDSLQIRFQVLDAYTLKPLEGVKLFLYKGQNDSLPLKGRPDYLGFSDAQGNAIIDFLPAGAYKLFATDDLNNSLKYDLPGEQIGFSDTLARAGDSLVYKLRMFKEPDTTVKLKNIKSPFNGRVNFKFSAPIGLTSITPIGDSLPDFKIYSEMANAAGDSMVYWFKPLGRDTVAFQITYADRTDTVKVKMPRNATASKAGGAGGKSRLSGAAGNANTLSVTSNLVNNQLNYFDTLRLLFSKPIDSLQLANIKLLRDTSAVPFELVYTDSIHRKIDVRWDVIPGEMYSMYIPRKTVKDQWNAYLDSTRFVFTVTGLNDYSSIRIQFEQTFSDKPVILQLVSKDDQVLQTQYLPNARAGQRISFDRLLSGSYKLRFVYDDNGNQKWDTGMYATHTQPERVVFFPQVMDVKQGFDLEFKWSKTVMPGNAGGKRR